MRRWRFSPALPGVGEEEAEGRRAEEVGSESGCRLTKLPLRQCQHKHQKYQPRHATTFCPPAALPHS